ncbi:MAG: DUF2785 domain-containing protein [Gammaproteobacteria bacterium]
MKIDRTFGPAFLMLALASWHPATSAMPGSSCHPLDYDRSDLLNLRAADFVIEDPDERRRFAIELLDCLGDPDPVLRDQVAYEAYVALLRGGHLDADTIRALRSSLIEQLDIGAEDGTGFRKPFAALVLSEVARADRMDPVFSDEERAALVMAATAYMRGIDDYRGFDQQTGWRHGVAHAADLLMQLSLNPALDRSQLETILDAVASQVTPEGSHFYIYGESGRLARPVLFIAMREVFDDREWANWIGDVTSAGPFGEWSEVFSSQAGLARLHNIRAFAQAIYVNSTASDQESLAPLRSSALEALKKLP